MSGPQPMHVPQVPQYSGNYGYQQPYPQQQPYPPQQQQYQQPVDLGRLISDNKTQLAALKKLEREKRRTEDFLKGRSSQERGGDPGVLRVGESTGGGEDDPYAPYENLETAELEKIVTRLRPGTTEYAIVQELLEEREFVDEQLDTEELGEEIDALEFFGVKVFDPNDENWLPAETKGVFDDTQTLIRSMQKRFPFATKIKWVTVKRKGRKIDALSDKVYPIQSTAESQLKFTRAQNQAMGEGRQERQQMFNQQPAGFSGSDIAALIGAVNDSTAKNQAVMFELVKALKNDAPKESPLKDLALMKDLFLTPQIEMVKAMHPKGGSAIDPMQLFTTMMTGAKTLASMGGSSGGGGDGILSSLVQQFLPTLMQQFQNMQQGGNSQQMLQPNPAQQQLPYQPRPQQQQQQQLPPQQQPTTQPKGTSVEQPAVAMLRQRSKKIIENLLSKKLTLDMVPRYIWRNGTQQEGDALLKMNLDQFKSVLLGSVDRNNATIKAFISNPDVVRGAQWIYEEFQRLATIVGICVKNGDEEQANSIVDWGAGPLVETSLLGQEAYDEFVRRYEITAEDLGLKEPEEDLPGKDEAGEDLPSGSKSVPATKQPPRAEEPKPSARSTPAITPNSTKKVVSTPVEAVEEEEPEVVETPRPRVKKKKRPSFMS